MEPAAKPIRTLIITGGRRRLMSTFPDGTEVVEEFDLNTHDLLLRRVKAPSRVGEGTWVYEVGEEVKRPETDAIISVSAENVIARQPVFFRKDTKAAFQWRVRNLPYSSDVFSVTADPATRKITIRTTNKK